MLSFEMCRGKGVAYEERWEEPASKSEREKTRGRRSASVDVTVSQGLVYARVRRTEENWITA